MFNFFFQIRQPCRTQTLSLSLSLSVFKWFQILFRIEVLEKKVFVENGEIPPVVGELKHKVENLREKLEVRCVFVFSCMFRYASTCIYFNKCMSHWVVVVGGGLNLHMWLGGIYSSLQCFGWWANIGKKWKMHYLYSCCLQKKKKKRKWHE